MSASLNYKSNLRPTGISDPGYNADAKAVAPGSSELYASDMRCFFAICFSCVVLAGVLRAESPAYVGIVSNSQSAETENSRSSRMKTTPALRLSISIRDNLAEKQKYRRNPKA